MRVLWLLASCGMPTRAVISSEIAISTCCQPTSCQVAVSADGLEVGAAVTLSTLEEVLKQQVTSQPPHKTRGFAAAAEQLRWFAGEHATAV